MYLRHSKRADQLTVSLSTNGTGLTPVPCSQTTYLVINGSCVFHAWVVNQVFEQASHTPDR